MIAVRALIMLTVMNYWTDSCYIHTNLSLAAYTDD